PPGPRRPRTGARDGGAGVRPHPRVRFAGAASPVLARLHRRRLPMSRLTLVGRIFFALALIALGADHFIFGEFVTGRAPPWPASVPGGAAWAYLTGAVLIAAGVAIITGKHARFAALLVG